VVTINKRNKGQVINGLMKEKVSVNEKMMKKKIEGNKSGMKTSQGRKSRESNKN
jgi:hypothetical protein